MEEEEEDRLIFRKGVRMKGGGGGGDREGKQKTRRACVCVCLQVCGGLFLFSPFFSRLFLLLCGGR